MFRIINFNHSVTAALCELLLNGVIEIDDSKHIVIKKDLEENQFYLSSVFKFIADSELQTMKKLVESFSWSLKNDKLKQLINQIVESLVENKSVESSKSKVIFFEKNYYKPIQQIVNGIVERIRAEILENGNMDEDTLILSVLLKESTLLNAYFSKHESEVFKKRFEELENTEVSILTKELIEDIVSSMAAITAIIAVSGSK